MPGSEAGVSYFEDAGLSASVADDTMLLEILLMVFFGLVEGRGRDQLSRQALLVFPRYLQLLHDLAGRFPLGLSMIKDGRAVLGPLVRSLLVDLGRVVERKELADEVGVAHLGGIEGDLDGLGVPGLVRADLLVGRGDGLAARIAHDGRYDAGDLPQLVFDSPETAGSKGRGLRRCGCGLLRALGFAGGFGLEIQRRGVDAVMEERGLRAVVEDVAQVGAALGAADLDPFCEERKVVAVLDVLIIDGRREAGPARAVLVLHLRAEQGRPAAGADIDPLVPKIIVFAGERPFGAALPHDIELLRR